MKVKSRAFIAIAAVAFLALNVIPGLAAAAASVTTVTLWSGPPPRALGSAAKDIPTITAYLPETTETKVSAIVICPGGGYAGLAMQHEGSAVAEWCNARGMAAFVLKYRLPKNGYLHPVPLMDAQRALSLVRARAGEWKVDPARIGIMGFSAGGHLASTLATHYHKDLPDAKDPIDRVKSRPDFAVLIYPVVTMKTLTHGGSRRNLLGPNPDPALVENLSNETQVTADTPPTFLLAATDDKAVPVQNSINFYLALVKAGVPAEMHLYDVGGHGFGVGRSATVAGRTWLDRLADWLAARGIAH